MQISVVIPTFKRHEELARVLTTLAFQTKLPAEIIIIDDDVNGPDLRTFLSLERVFRLLDVKGIEWKVVFGKGLGQHHSHQTSQEIAKHELIFRVDDDTILEPDVLALLERQFILVNDPVGAVAPAILLPDGPINRPKGLKNVISDLNLPNSQWFLSTEIQEAEHLYSCYLYKKKIADFNTNLSKVCFREETMHTHDIYRKGYKLLIEPNAIMWHMCSPEPRKYSTEDIKGFEHDEQIFQQYLKEINTPASEKTFHVHLNNGIGDHFAFKHILSDLQAKYPKILIGATFPDVFFDTEGVNLISIAEMEQLLSRRGRNADDFNIYKYMWDKNHKGNLVNAFKDLYDSHIPF